MHLICPITSKPPSNAKRTSQMFTNSSSSTLDMSRYWTLRKLELHDLPLTFRIVRPKACIYIQHLTRTRPSLFLSLNIPRGPNTNLHYFNNLIYISRSLGGSRILTHAYSQWSRPEKIHANLYRYAHPVLAPTVLLLSLVLSLASFYGLKTMLCAVTHISYTKLPICN